MVGNSLKSDVLPVISIGGHGFHVPYHITWGHEKIEKTIEHRNFMEFKKLTEILEYL
jgi:putative hydrolase of the HAD superfamily